MHAAISKSNTYNAWNVLGNLVCLIFVAVTQAYKSLGCVIYSTRISTNNI